MAHGLIPHKFPFQALLIPLVLGCFALPSKAAEHPIVAARETIVEGDLLFAQGSVEPACLRYELAFATAPEWWYAAYKHAQCNALEGSTPQALYLLSKAARGEENLFLVELELARYYRANGEFELSEHHFLAALNTTRGAIEPMLELADLYEAEGKLSNALVWLNKAYYFSPGNLTVRSRLARVGEGLGRLYSAEEHLRYLAVYGVNPRRNMARLARFYQRNGENGGSLRILRLMGRGHVTPDLRDLPAPKFPPPGTP